MGIGPKNVTSLFPSSRQLFEVLMPTTMGKRDLYRRGELLTAKQVMNRLLADPDLRQRQVTCALPAVRYGKGWRFFKSDLEEWISHQKQSHDEKAR